MKDDNLASAFGNPLTWFEVARQMHKAATVLYEQLNQPSNPVSADDDVRLLDLGCFHGGILLLGYAVENALKGLILVHESPTVSPNGKIQLEALFGKDPHDLVKLWDKTDYDLQGVDLKLLRRLTRAIKWAGRYGYPLDEAEFNRIKTDDPRRSEYPTDLDRVGQLIDDAESFGVSMMTINAVATLDRKTPPG